MYYLLIYNYFENKQKGEIFIMITMSNLKMPNTQKTTTSIQRNINENKVVNNYNQVMNDVQQNYLIQNPNGTFKINPVAYTIYPTNIMNKITTGMNYVNQEILSGNIKFKVTRNNNKVEVTPTYVSKALKEKTMNSIIKINNNNNNRHLEGSNCIFLPNGFEANDMYNVHWTWACWSGDVVSSTPIYEQLYWLFADNNASSWANTVLTAQNNWYTLTLSWIPGNTIVNVSY